MNNNESESHDELIRRLKRAPFQELEKKVANANRVGPATAKFLIEMNHWTVDEYHNEWCLRYPEAAEIEMRNKDAKQQ